MACSPTGWTSSLRPYSRHEGTTRLQAAEASAESKVQGYPSQRVRDLYRIRLRHHAVPELLAGAGIAVGVALVFGVLVANTSITGSMAGMIRAVNGSARLELIARSSEGFSQNLANKASELPGVQTAAYLLRENAIIVGPRGRQSIQLVGLTPGIVTLGGSATQNLGAGAYLLQGGIGLPSGVAKSIGARARNNVTLLTQGAAHPVLLRAILNGGTIGALANSPVAVALLPIAQRIAEQPGRVTQVLIMPRPGADRQVAAELRKLVAGRVSVVPADHELGVLNETAKPLNQSTTLFASISAMVGFLLALNATLLTVPDRRRFVAEMLAQGFDSPQLILTLAFQALLLGVMASLVGLALGYVLAHTLFTQSPVYLAAAFPISVHQTIHLTVVLAALFGGIFAALCASLPPIFDLRSGRPTSTVPPSSGDPDSE